MITRRIAAQELITTASEQGAVAESAELVKQHFLIEKRIVDDASRAFEGRIGDAFANKVDDRFEVVTA